MSNDLIARLCAGVAIDDVKPLMEEAAAEIERLQRELDEARKDAPTQEMIEAGAEVLYGHPKEKAIEWAKRDKFESCEWQAEKVFMAMIAAKQPQA